jgi:hypothetical protein
MQRVYNFQCGYLLNKYLNAASEGKRGGTAQIQDYLNDRKMF